MENLKFDLQKKVNIVIVNSVPLNGGDEALLRATIFGIRDNLPESSISVLCNDPDLANNYFSDIKFDWDWEYAIGFSFKSKKIMDRIRRKIRNVLKERFKVDYFKYASRIFSSRREKRVYGKLKKADFIIVSPGGYIHDFYGFEKRIKTLEFIQNHFKKKYYFFCQSIGPFWKNDGYSDLKEVLSNAEKIILREHYSRIHLKKINYTGENVVVLNDIAFYLSKKYRYPVKNPSSILKIVINFREWGFEVESKENFGKALNLVSYLISQGYKITFISTCQGIKGYKDDSKFAQRIIDNLEDKYKNNCSLLSAKFTLTELLKELSDQDAYIGMRLHGAILSLVAGIPALNIAYEDKTMGIYESLDIKDFCFSYKEDFSLWIEKVNYFFANSPTYISKIESIRSHAAEEVAVAFNYLYHKN